MNWTKLVRFITKRELFRIFWILIGLVLVKVLMLAGFSLMQVHVEKGGDSAHRQAKQKDSQKALEKRAETVKHKFDMQNRALAQEQEQQNTGQSGDKGNLSEQWQKLREKQEKLKRKEEELQELRKEIDKKLAEQKELKKKLENVLEEAKSIKKEKIKHLVDVYSNMQPKKAAQALETLKQEIAVKILAGMQGRTAGEILSFVQSEKAARLSEALTDFQTPFSD